MLKVVVFDCGIGGELFADHLEKELGVVEVIRVIDWRNSGEYLKSSHSARKTAECALKPYIGNVDLIIVANYLLATTSLKYFKNKYQSQKFIGFVFKTKRVIMEKPTLILTTKATTKSFSFVSFSHRIKAKTICFDTWPLLIDDGELTYDVLKDDVRNAMSSFRNFSPEQIMLACGQFSEVTPDLRKIFGHNVRFIDSFEHTIGEAKKALKIRGSSC